MTSSASEICNVHDSSRKCAYHFNDIALKKSQNKHNTYCQMWWRELSDVSRSRRNKAWTSRIWIGRYSSLGTTLMLKNREMISCVFATRSHRAESWSWTGRWPVPRSTKSRSAGQGPWNISYHLQNNLNLWDKSESIKDPPYVLRHSS